MRINSISRHSKGVNNANDDLKEKENELTEKLDALNSMIKRVMGRRSSSTIAKECGVSVSTITRIRNGEIKREINYELLDNILSVCDPNDDGLKKQLKATNKAVEEAYLRKENVKWDQDRKELDFLEEQIKNSMFNSGVFLRKVKGQYNIIPDVELYPEMSYEIAFENGEKRGILFFTHFYTKRRIDQMEERKVTDPEYSRFYCRHYRTIVDFREMRTLHPEYENTELVIVFNYEDSFRYNVDTLKKLSNKDNVTLALMDFNTGRLIEEVCLDGRKKGIIKELGLVRD